MHVTHDQAEAMTLGNRVAILKDGRLQQCDAPRILYEEPENTKRAPERGARVALRPLADEAHLFDSESGERLG